MTNHGKNGQAQAGFSLVEMAIVLAIVALLMAGLLPTLSSQIEQQRRNESRKQLDEIQQALTGFAIVNGRLPCPADGTIPAGQPNAGQEAKTGASCTSITGNAAWGVLPWAILGVSETDAWGRRFTYRVTGTWADSTDGTGASCTVTAGISFQLCSSGNLFVYTDATKTTSIANNIPAIVISHGVNGYGAYNTGGQQLTGASGDESENADNNNSFVNHDFTPAFDDLVVWISPTILLNRMVAAGKLP